MSSSTPDRGVIGIAVTITIVVTLAGAALIVDGGRAMVARRHAANTAESAARWAITDQSLLGPFDPSRARAAAIGAAAGAGVAADDVSVEVRTDRYGRPEVMVTVTERRRSVFLVLVAVPRMTVTASGAATMAWSR